MKKYFIVPFLLIGMILVINSCQKIEVTSFANQKIQNSHPIDSDSLAAFTSGTLLMGKTYYITHDITVKKGDTLYFQAGTNVIVKNNSQVNIQGVLRMDGTQDQPIFINSDSGTPGSWGGFQCDTAQAISIKWAHIDNTGGPDPRGSARRSVFINNKNAEVDIEDSWFSNGQDDMLSLWAAHILLLRNTISSSGSTDGEAINIKNGATGVVAYNVIYSQAGTGVKLETNKSAPIPQTNVDIYNNTIVSGGWRRGAAEPGRGFSVGLYAKGNIYNNIIVNCYQGLEIFADADVPNVQHGNNLFYATVENFTDSTVNPYIVINLRANFYPSDAVGSPVRSDLISKNISDLNPLFVSYDGLLAVPNGAPNKNNFHLQSGSPAFGNGNPKYNQDIGAYPLDGRGNKH